MIKNSLRTTICFSTCLWMITFSLPVLSQIPPPGQWDSFVGDASRNVLVQDTFLFQSFENDPLDTWAYTVSGSASCADVSSAGIKGQGGKFSLKLPLASGVAFARFGKPSLYVDICICASYAGGSLSGGDMLMLEILKEGESIRSEWYTTPPNVKSFSYGAKGTPIRFRDNPQGFIITTPETNKNGYFCIDNALAFGSIPRYSLFSGEGDWNNESLWTHLPALRHRSALVNGNASVLSDVQCKELAVGNGSVNVAKDVSLVIDKLILYSSDADGFVNVEGNLTVNDQVVVNKTFKEKGKWYFISFPFDVYLSGMDTEFELKDDAPNEGGNYFYVRSYDGSRRASSGNVDGNWPILKVAEVSGSSPVFEKYKGYLIAIDNLASGRTIRFASHKKMLPDDFGKVLSFPVKAPLGGTKEDDNGWCLCGNPFPSLLSLTSIGSNSSLDGYIYMYEDGKYNPYLIGSNYALPPFSAFFVKAKADTEIVFQNRFTDDCILLSASSPMSAILQEPCRSDTPLRSELVTDQMKPVCYLNGNQLVLENMPDRGTIQLINSSGYVLLCKKVDRGSSVSDLVLEPGLYILKIETECYSACRKLVKVR